jgi:enoyl-CoA hydratase/carnithine racemase
MAYELIEVRTEAEKVGIITLNRPKQLNALNDAADGRTGPGAQGLDADEAIGCMIITGSEKAFAAGADISRHGHLHLCRRLQGRLHHAQLGNHPLASASP